MTDRIRVDRFAHTPDRRGQRFLELANLVGDLRATLLVHNPPANSSRVNPRLRKNAIRSPGAASSPAARTAGASCE
jgi:hypothetical protein